MAFNKFTDKLKSNSDKLMASVPIAGLASQVSSKVGQMIENNKGNSGTNEVTIGMVKKQINALVKEKAKMYELIGMEVYDLYKTNNLEIPQIEAFFKKLDGIDVELNKLNGQREAKEKIKTPVVCSCGEKLSENAKFCLSCGKKVEDQTMTCPCGNEINNEISFCPNCGMSNEAIKSAQSDNVTVPKIECVCGEMVEIDQLMCMSCGRRIMQK